MLVVDFKTFLAPETGGSGRPTGLTKDAGFEAGLRRTYAVSAGEGPPVAYEVTTLVPLSRFRMRWRLAGWTSDSTLQVRILPAARIIDEGTGGKS